MSGGIENMHRLMGLKKTDQMNLMCWTELMSQEMKTREKKWIWEIIGCKRKIIKILLKEMMS